MKVHLRGRGLVGNHLVLLPWRVPAFISNNIVTAQTFWERLWMNCEVQSTGQIRGQRPKDLSFFPIPYIVHYF